MLQLPIIALLTIAAATVSAVDLTFRRYAQVGCEDINHIRKDTDLHDPHCKTFTSDEPAFYSFQLHPREGLGEMDEKLCKAIVYSQEDCEGAGYTYGGMLFLSLLNVHCGICRAEFGILDMRQYADKCANTTIPGRSVRISCDERPSSPPVKLPMPTTHYTTVTTHVHHSDVQVPEQTTTMVMIPAHQYEHYGYDGYGDGYDGYDYHHHYD